MMAAWLLKKTPREEDGPRQGHVARIRVLREESVRGLWFLIVFLMVSLGSYAAIEYYPVLKPVLHDYLGPPPPSHLISMALFVYVFSAIVLILGRMMEGREPRGGWQHLGYLVGFYLFYLVAEALEENFWAVFATGLTVLSLEGYRIWNACAEKIRECQEAIERMDRWSGFS